MEFNNYAYVIQSRKRDGTKFLKCKFARNQFCKGTGKVASDGEFIALHPHCHEPIQDVIGVMRMELINLAVISENTGLRTIYDGVAQRFPEAAAQYTFPIAESTMRAARRRSLPPIPETLTELGNILIGDLGERFGCHGRIIHNINTVNGSSVLFYCQNLLDRAIGGMTEIHCDATFKVVPNRPRATQLFTVHGIIQNTSVVLLYALMESKSTGAYLDVLCHLKSTVPTLLPEVIITDFEGALHNALVITYPESELHGCFFHYAQAVWRKMRKFGYLPLVNENTSALRLVKQMMILPLLPPDRMREGYNVIVNNTSGVDLRRLTSYISRFWLDSIGSERLSVYGLPRRTNNHLESFHNKIKIKFKVIHPGIWFFIGEICKFLKDDHILLSQLLEGREARRQRQCYLRRNQLLDRARRDLEGGVITISEYCLRVSHYTDSLEEGLRNWANNINANLSDDSEEDNNLENDEIPTPDSNAPLVLGEVEEGVGDMYEPTVEMVYGDFNAPPVLEEGVEDMSEPNVQMVYREMDEEQNIQEIVDRALIRVTEHEILPDHIGSDSEDLGNGNEVIPEENLDSSGGSIDDRDMARNARCVVCLTRRREFLFRNCNHFAVCGVCIKRFGTARHRTRSSNNEGNQLIETCPQCRTLITLAPIRVFV